MCIYIQVIGTERLPEYKDRNNFPYVVATIQEALRIDTVGKNWVKLEPSKFLFHTLNEETCRYYVNVMCCYLNCISRVNCLISTVHSCLNSNSNLSVIVAAGSLFHLAEKDFEIGEYAIPKGAIVVADNRPIMYDEQVNGYCFVHNV